MLCSSPMTDFTCMYVMTQLPHHAWVHPQGAANMCTGFAASLHQATNIPHPIWRNVGAWAAGYYKDVLLDVGWVLGAISGSLSSDMSLAIIRLEQNAFCLAKRMKAYNCRQSLLFCLNLCWMCVMMNGATVWQMSCNRHDQLSSFATLLCKRKQSTHCYNM